MCTVMESKKKAFFERNAFFFNVCYFILAISFSTNALSTTS